MASAMGFWALVGTACYPVAEVLLLCLVGTVLANSRVNKFPAEARKHLNRMVFMIFTSALVFVNLGPAVTLQTLLDWWFMPFSVFFNSVIGFVLGHLVVVLTKPSPQLVRLTIACCTVGNMSNLPLVLIDAICSNSGAVFGDRCALQGLAYSSYGMLAGVIVMWSFVYSYMEAPRAESERRRTYRQLDSVSKKTAELGFPVDGPPGEDGATFSRGGDRLIGSAADEEAYVAETPEHSNNEQSESHDPTLNQSQPHTFQGIQSQPHDLSEEAPAPRFSGRVIEFADRTLVPAASERGVDLAELSGGGERMSCLSWLRQQEWDKMAAPPVCGAVLAIVIGGIRPLQHLFFGPNARLKLLTDAITSLAGAMTPCMMLVLGGNLAEGPSASEMSVRTIVGIGCVRLVFLPLLGVGVMKGADALSLLPPNDPLFRFVLLLQFAMPTAINVGIAATMHGVGERETSAVLFWSYLACTFTMPAFIMLFLYILV